jgi:uncharacterized protein (TIGR03118 family)
MSVTHRFRCPRLLVAAGCLALGLAPGLAVPAAAQGYQQMNLVSDLPGMAARTDPNLVNPWGIAFLPNGPLWIADNGTGVSTVYQGNGQIFPTPLAPLVLTIPTPGGTGTAAPTGVVFNNTVGFAVTPGRPAVFLYATEDGTISGWNPSADPTHAILKVNNSGPAVYKGLAVLGNQLYAANFRANSVDVFKSDFSSAGSFTDPTVPAGFAPFGIQNLGGTLVVTYAKQNGEKHDDVAGPGNGYVDLFNSVSHTFTRLISGGTPTSPLNSPWGLAFAPANFGPFSGQLLVGNFGDGRINAFDPRTGAFRGSLAAPNGQAISIEGLWSLTVGTDPADLFHLRPFVYFTAGIDGEQHGLFGRLQAVGGRARSRGADR